MVAVEPLRESPTAPLYREIHYCISQMELLKVVELKALCRAVNLPMTGKKSVLQGKLRSFLNETFLLDSIDAYRPRTVRILIDKLKVNGDSIPLPNYSTLRESLRKGLYRHPEALGYSSNGDQPVGNPPAPSQLYSDPISNLYNNQTVKPSPQQPPPQQQQKYKIPILKFKPSPFYKLVRLLPQSIQRINITNGRGVTNIKFQFSKEDWDFISKNSNIQLYLFSGILASDNTELNKVNDSKFIQFPHPIEIRMNGTLLKDNVRGIKNQIGTAKPANLTKYLKPALQNNHLEIIYAFTKFKYGVYCYVVNEIKPDQIVTNEILKHPKISKEATIQYLQKMMKEDEDLGLITTSTVMSLQCPISYTRMKYPALAVTCKHLKCFDALWFLHSQEQVPTWQCPVCQNPIKIEDIAICEFVDEILKKCDEDIEQVELSPDGSWVPIEEEENTHPNSKNNDSDSENDHRLTNVKSEPQAMSLDSNNFNSNHSTSHHHGHHAEPIVIDLDSESDTEESQALGITTQAPANQENNGTITDNASTEGNVPSQNEQNTLSYRESLPLTASESSNEILNNLVNTTTPIVPVAHNNSQPNGNSNIPTTPNANNHTLPKQTLDPRAGNNTTSSLFSQNVLTTPTATLRTSSDNTFDSREELMRRLGLAPLNNRTDLNSKNNNSINNNSSDDDDDLPLQNSRRGSPTPVSINNKMLQPQPNNLVHSSASSNLLALTAETPSLPPVRFPSNANFQLVNGFSNAADNAQVQPQALPRPQENLASRGSILGLTGNIGSSVVLPLIPPGASPNIEPPSFTNTPQFNSQNWSSNNLLGMSGDASTISHITQNSGDSQHHSSRPNLPPALPPLPSAIDPKLGNYLSNSSSTSSNISSTVAPNQTKPHSRMKKPIVSPFIPKRPYINNLPQKRNSSQADLGIALEENDPFVVDLTSD